MKEETHSRDLRAGQKVTWMGVVANSLLMVFKFLAGVFGHSQALIADAIHSVSDLFTDLIVLLGIRIGRKGPDEDHPFGHARLETLASAVVGIALIITACYIGITAALNIYRHTEYTPTPLALVGAGVSILVKELLYHYTVRVGRRIHSQLIVANAWHHRTDSLSSVAVFLGVGASLINPGWHILDAFAALLVSFFVIKVGIDILRDTIREFTDRAPAPEILREINACARGVEGVLDIHDVRVRSSGGLYLMEAHIVVDGSQTVYQGHHIAKEVEQCLLDDVAGVAKVIVHVDPSDIDTDEAVRK
ncbi:MAG: cation diffusion facilitator family transporter [Deltaproteobacteria bacterium]|jgi:cation diffusion facilitator family transporter